MDGGINAPLPEAFLERIRGQLGDGLPAFLCAMEEPARRGIRFNPLRPFSRENIRGVEEAIPWAEDGFYLSPDSDAGATLYHEAGAFYLQEPSAMIPAAVMDAKPGERIADLCAAPGGKSTQMGCAMAGKGLLLCNDPVPKRARTLAGNLERMGVSNGLVTCESPEKLAAWAPEAFDGVMVDAPCSGEGMFRRHPETREEWSEEKAKGCADRQREILDAAAAMVRPGGRLVYATCTFHPAENDEQVEAFLSRHPDFAREAFLLPGVDGSSGSFTCWPHQNKGEGQFAALLRRRGEGTGAMIPAGAPFRMSREESRLWGESGLPRPNGRMGDTLIRLPEEMNLAGLRILRAGLHLGQIRGKNWFPDHALALSAEPPDSPRTEMSAEEALRYLAGETIPAQTRGWTLMTFRGLVLGWGKGSGGMIRNHYPKGLRNARLAI